MIDPVSPALVGRQSMAQRWENLTFLHWRVDPGRVAPLLPAGTRPDVFDGFAWVRLGRADRLPAGGCGRRPRRAVPWLGTFAETNVRLYSIDATRRRGVVFRSLESARLAVMIGARLSFGVPYTWARMRIERDGETITYTTSRRLPGPYRAGGRMLVTPGPRTLAWQKGPRCR